MQDQIHYWYVPKINYWKKKKYNGRGWNCPFHFLHSSHCGIRPDIPPRSQWNHTTVQYVNWDGRYFNLITMVYIFLISKFYGAQFYRRGINSIVPPAFHSTCIKIRRKNWRWLNHHSANPTIYREKCTKMERCIIYHDASEGRSCNHRRIIWEL